MTAPLLAIFPRSPKQITLIICELIVYHEKVAVFIIN